MDNKSTILKLKNIAQNQNKKTEITIEDVKISWNSRNMKVNDKIETFHLLTILNLLNSAIKENEFKNIIHYGGIKNNVSRLVSFLIKNNKLELVDDLWINPDEGPCVYIVSNSFQFTFHNLPICSTISDFISSNKNVIKKWEGIRLQLIAIDLFKFSKIEMLKHNFNSKN